jgi:hypothetical protein
METPDNRCSIHSDEDIRFVKNPEGSHHYGKWICGNPECSKFVRWAKKPATTEELQTRQNNIIVALGRLYERDKSDKTDKTQKAIKFMVTMHNVVHLNLVQQSQYDKIMQSLQ